MTQARMYKRCVTLALICLLGVAGSAMAQTSINIVAVVNGDLITSHQLDRAVEPEIKARGINRNNASAVAALRREILDELIDETLIHQQLASEGLDVTQAMVDQELANIASQNNMDVAAFTAEMARQGIEGEALQSRMRNNIYAQYVIGMYYIDEIKVPEADVLNYYREAMRVAPMVRARISMIVYPPTVNANEWASKISRGQVSFADAARQVSIGPNAANGGDMGMMSVNDLAEGLRQMVMSMQRGQVSPVVESGVNSLQVRLDEAVFGARPALNTNLFPDDQTYRAIENMLVQEKIESLMKSYADGLRANADIQIRLN